MRTGQVMKTDCAVSTRGCSREPGVSARPAVRTLRVEFAAVTPKIPLKIEDASSESTTSIS